MADIYFQCSCQKSLAVDEAGVGQTIQCPDCGASLVVPSPEIGWTHLPCGSEMAAPKYMAGKIVQCVVCKANTLVPAKKNTEAIPKKQMAVPRLARWGAQPAEKDKVKTGPIKT